MTVKIIRKEYISILRKNMISLKFRLKKINKTTNFLLEEIKHNGLINKKYKKTC